MFIIIDSMYNSKNYEKKSNNKKNYKNNNKIYIK